MVAAVIMTLIILTVGIMFSSVNFLARFDTLAFENKDVSREYAEACLEHARLKLRLSGSYAGNETIAVGSSTCAIMSVQSAGNNKVITASSTADKRTTTLELTITSTTLDTVSLKEK